MVKSGIDLFVNISLMAIVAVIADTAYNRFDETFPAIVLMLCLSSLVSQSLGHIFAIVFGHRAVVAAILTSAWLVLFGGLYVTERDLNDFFKDTMLDTDPLRHTIAHTAVLIYGFGRCGQGFISPVMYKFKLDDEDFDDSTMVLIYELIALRVISYLCLKVKVNWYLIEIMVKKVKTRLFVNN